MAGTKEGSIKAMQTLLSRNPDHFKEIGAIGGRNGNTGGFYKDRKRASENGKTGGSKSKVNHKFMYSLDGYSYYTKKSSGKVVRYETNK